MIEIEQTISTWPQLGSEVTLGGAAAAHAARRIALGQAVHSGRMFVDLDAFTPGSAAAPDAIRRSEPAAAPVADLPPRHRRVTDPLMRDLVAHGVLAPSGGNTQPWQWRVNGHALQLFLDRSRGSGIIDFELAGSHVALGCAAENVILAAHAAGREVHLDVFPDATRPDHVATFVLASTTGAVVEPHWRDELFSQIARRHTDRTLSARQPLAPAELDTLTAAVRSIAGVRVQWLTEDVELAAIGELLGAADRLRMLNSRTHLEMFRELRWTRDEAESTRDGIDVATLCLSASDRAGLELCRDWPSLDLVRAWRGGRGLERMAKKYVAASSAIGLITLPEARAVDYFNGGRAVQRLWLTATEKGLAIHPMTALPYFFARLLRADGDQLDDYTIGELRRLRYAYERRFEVSPNTGEIMLFRVAFGGAPSVRSLRRPLDDVLETNADKE